MPYICSITPKTKARWPVIFSGMLFPILLLSVGGCGREVQGGNGGNGVLSIPPSGFVRIVSRQIADAAPAAGTPTAGTLHYKWSLIGERNWQNPQADKTGFTLGETYPLNSTTKRGGCNVWECDLTARSSEAGVQWNLLVHGSNGQTARAEGNAPLSPGGRMEDIVRVVQTRDEPVRLPADVILARVGDQEVRLKVAD